MGAIDASDALFQVHGTVFDPINSADLYPAAGASDDWYKSLGMRYAFTTELRDTGHHGFELPKSQIIPSGEEMWAAFERLAAESNFPKARKMLHHTYLEVLLQLLMMTMMMTSIFLALTTRKRSPRKLPKSAKKGWTPMLPKRPKNLPSSPRLQCCSTANPGTMRPTWTQCSKLLRPSKWTASFGELANLSP